MNKTPYVMIVDDDVSILDILRQSFSMEGFTCEAFTRAEDALVALERIVPEILLTDIVMPGMGGFELVRRAKSLHPSMTAIVMTGFVEEFSYDEAIRSGAADFIKKPFTVQELLVRIKHAKQQDHLRTLSITDELTGLSNRRGFFAFAQQQMKHARRKGERMVMFFADVDDLKTINDTLGHVAGDRALADAAHIFIETFRDSDIIARMGGDEFALILGNTPDAGIETVLLRLEKHLAEYNTRQDGSFQLAVSVGFSVFDPANPVTVDDLIREADMRMYEQKQRKKAARNAARASESVTEDDGRAAPPKFHVRKKSKRED
jgi:two-component system, cell cycle response regulator